MSVPRKDARELARGRRAGQLKHARRLYRDWDEELAVNDLGRPHISPTKKLEMEEGLAQLRDRHPGIERYRSDPANGDGSPPELSRHARAKIHAKRGRARADEQLARGTQATRTRAGRIGRSAYRQSGIPATASDWTRTTLQVLGGMVGVSLLYLVLNNAASRGGGNVPQALNAGAIAFRRLFSPHADVLGGGPALSYSDLAAAGVVAGPVRPANLPTAPIVTGPRSPAGFSNFLSLRTGPAAALTGPLRIAPLRTP